MNKPKLGACDLPLPAFAAQLRDDFVEVEQRAGNAGMRERQQPAMGVGGNLAAIGHLAVSDETAAFALGAEAEIFQHHDHRAGEAVIDAGSVHILGAVARHGVGLAARLHCAGGGERGHQEDVLMGVALAAAENVDRLFDAERFRTFGRRQDERRAAV